jgi:hypothetical protein
MQRMYSRNSPRRAVNLSIDGDLLGRARSGVESVIGA